MWYSTKAPTRPSNPSADSPFKIPITLSTTLISGQNGIPTPLNKTSRTMPSANIDIPVCVKL